MTNGRDLVRLTRELLELMIDADRLHATIRPLGRLWIEPFEVLCPTCGYRLKVANGHEAQRAARAHDRAHLGA
jgi:hypothetical protein